MSDMRWFSVSSDWINDPKLIKLGDVLCHRFLQCLCMAAKEYKDGYLPDLETCAIFVRKSTDDVRKDFERLIQAGLLEIRLLDLEQRYYVTNWLDHQKSVEYMEKKKAQNRRRVRRHRKTTDSVKKEEKEEKRQEEENTYTYTEYALPDALRNGDVMHYTEAANGADTPSELPSASGNPPVYLSRSARRSWAAPLPPIEQETISADIVALADYFADRIGRKTPDLRFKPDQWRDPLERILATAGNVPAAETLIDQAVTYMDQTNLSIGTPKSIVNVAASLHRRSNLPQQQATTVATAGDSYREVFQ